MGECIGDMKGYWKMSDEEAAKACDFCPSAESAVGYDSCHRYDASQRACQQAGCQYEKVGFYGTCTRSTAGKEFSQAFTGASESAFSVVHVFAAFGLGVVLYGSFRHFVK